MLPHPGGVFSQEGNPPGCEKSTPAREVLTPVNCSFDTPSIVVHVHNSNVSALAVCSPVCNPPPPSLSLCRLVVACPGPGDDAATAYKDAVDRFLGKKVELKFVQPKPVGLVSSGIVVSLYSKRWYERSGPSTRTVGVCRCASCAYVVLILPLSC